MYQTWIRVIDRMLGDISHIDLAAESDWVSMWERGIQPIEAIRRAMEWSLAEVA